jgi:hypothetical protein
MCRRPALEVQIEITLSVAAVPLVTAGLGAAPVDGLGRALGLTVRTLRARS